MDDENIDDEDIDYIGFGERVSVAVGTATLRGSVATNFTDDIDEHTVEIDADQTAQTGIFYIICLGSAITREGE